MSRSTANAIRLLVVPLAFGILLSVLSRSLEQSIHRALSHTLRGDLVVTSLGQLIGNWSQPMHEEIEQRLKNVPGVARVAATRFVPWRLHGPDGETEIGIKAFDPPLDDEPLFALHDLDFATARERVFSGGQVLLSKSFQVRHGVGPGADLVLDTPTGTRRFVVAGIVDDYAHPGGVVSMSRARYRESWNDPLVTHFRVALEEGESADAVATRITRELGQSWGLQVLQPRALRSQVESSVSQSFAFVRALEAVALFVALLGTAGACALGLSDRKRELSLLRAVGISRRELKGLLAWELWVSGLATALYAVVVGGLLGALWAKVPLAEVLGWQVAVAYPWDRFVTALAMGSLGMLGAGLLPMRGLDRRLAPSPG